MMEQAIYEKIYNLTIHKQIKWEGVMDDSYFITEYKQLYFIYKPVCKTLRIYEYDYYISIYTTQDFWDTVEPLMSINLYVSGNPIPKLEDVITILVEADRQAEKEAEEERKMQLLVDTFADVKIEGEDSKEEKKETWLDKLKRFFYD